MARLSPTSDSNILRSHAHIQRYGIFPLIVSSLPTASMARTKCSGKRIQCKFYQTEKLMQIAVQLLAFYLLTNSILFFLFRIRLRSFSFLFILNSLMSFINRFQLIAIARWSCVVFSPRLPVFFATAFAACYCCC